VSKTRTKRGEGERKQTIEGLVDDSGIKFFGFDFFLLVVNDNNGTKGVRETIGVGGKQIWIT
jgi:hypothetical protein